MQALSDPDALARMLERCASGPFIGIAEGAEFINLILEVVRVDGARAYAIPVGQSLDFSRVVHASWTIPQHMKSHAGADPGKGVNLASVAEFFLQSRRRSGLQKLAKARTGVGEPPGSSRRGQLSWLN